MRGDGQCAVFDERIGVAQVGDVFTRGALAGLAASRNGIRAVGVEAECVAVDDRLQVGTDVVEVDLGVGGLGVVFCVAQEQGYQRLAFAHRGAGLRAHLQHLSGCGR